MTRNTINCNGRLVDLSVPRVMGIVNATPDSFYSQSRCETQEAIISKTRRHLEDGASFIDLGAYSTRPGCRDISADEEIQRLDFALSAITREFPDAIVSVDTFRSKVADFVSVKYGVPIINDISGGLLDPEMLATVARNHSAYILMHMVGTPQDMQLHCDYTNMMDEIIKFFAVQVEKLKLLGAGDIVLDPGFGFSKNLDQNYELMSKIDEFAVFNLPILVGISRKSMIYRLLDSTPEDSLNGTSVLNTIAVSKGARILRVHDVKPAIETIRICEKAGLVK